MSLPKGSTESIASSTDPNANITKESELKNTLQPSPSELSLTVPNGPPPEKPPKKSCLKSSHESLADEGEKNPEEKKQVVHVTVKDPSSSEIITMMPDTKYLEKVAGNRTMSEDLGPSPSPTRRPSFAKRASISIDIMRRKSVERIQHTFAHYKGIVLAMISSVFFTITTVIVKHLRDVHPGEMACFRFLGILLFTIPMIFTAGVNPWGPRDKRHFLILRGIAGASSLYLRYSALHYLPIANATVVVLSMPVFVCIFARIFLKEPCGIFHVVALAVTLIGIGFTTKISTLIGLTEDEGVDKYKEMLGLAYSMGATLIGSSVYIFVRKVKECHNSVILFNFAIVAIAETSILTAIDDGFTLPHVGYAPWFLVLLAILSFYAQLLLTTALQLEEASLVSVTRASMEVVCAFIFQMVIFGQIPDMYAFIGAFLVTSSVLLTAARKWVVVLPHGHIGRKLLGFTLK